jgi:hypothetical protein
MLVLNEDALFHLVSGLIPSPKKVAYKKDASLLYPSFKDEEEEMFLTLETQKHLHRLRKSSSGTCFGFIFPRAGVRTPVSPEQV